MSDLSLYRKIISGRSGGWTGPLRAGLSILEMPYAYAVTLRNRRFDRHGPQCQLPVPVISAGNITAGGTGKTPFVIDLVRRLEAMGRKPAVIARGYKASGGQTNEEQRLIQRACPAAICLTDPDRWRAGMKACREFGADLIVLDDGFQHRRLERTMDFVLIDATCPFGYGHVLPRGLLREPLDGLARADALVITRSDQVRPAELGQLQQELGRWARNPLLLKCRHRVTGISRIDGSPVDETIAGRPVFLFAGIGNPSAFADTAASLGCEITGRRWFPDHHHYTAADVAGLLASAPRQPDALLLTTEKDAIKLADLDGVDGSRIRVVRIAIDFQEEDDIMLQSMLEMALREAKPS